MKRTIIIFITLLILFAFTSCDPILEMLYPDEKMGDGPNNTINVFVEVYQDILDQTEYRNAPRINVRLLRSNDGGFTFTEHFGEGEVWDIKETWDSRSFVFSYIPPGEYKVLIYWDSNWDWMPNNGESNVYARKWEDWVTENIFIPEDAPPEGVYIEMIGQVALINNALGI